MTGERELTARDYQEQYARGVEETRKAAKMEVALDYVRHRKLRVTLRLALDAGCFSARPQIEETMIELLKETE